MRATVDSREALAFSACAWKLSGLSPPDDAVQITVLNSRDPNPLVLGIARGTSKTTCGIGYSVVTKRDYRLLHMEFPSSGMAIGFVRTALAEYKDRVLRGRVPGCDDGVPAWAYDGDEGWVKSPPLHRRRLDTVHLPGSVVADTTRDVTTFLSPETAARYAAACVPASRTYLFYGAPGTGKTTTTVALATEVGWGLATVRGDCGYVPAAIRTAPARCLVVIEDGDLVPRGDMIEALDSSTGIIIVVTNASPTAIEDAVRRRVDRAVAFGPPLRAQYTSMLKRFGHDDKTAARFATDVPSGCSMAVLEKFLVHCMHADVAPSDAIRHLVGMADLTRDERPGGMYA